MWPWVNSQALFSLLNQWFLIKHLKVLEVFLNDMQAGWLIKVTNVPVAIIWTGEEDQGRGEREICLSCPCKEKIECTPIFSSRSLLTKYFLFLLCLHLSPGPQCTQCCLCVAHTPLGMCDVSISLLIFSWQSTAVISPHATHDLSEAWRGLPGAVAYLTDHLISSFFFGNSEHFFPILSLYLSFTRISKHVLLYLLYFVIVSHLRLVLLTVCCWIVSLHYEFPADSSWNHCKVSAFSGCHMAICAASSCRFLLLDEIPMHVAARGHILCYSVLVCESLLYQKVLAVPLLVRLWTLWARQLLTEKETNNIFPSQMLFLICYLENNQTKLINVVRQVNNET